jgi:hypothetical protein
VATCTPHVMPEPIGHLHTQAARRIVPGLGARPHELVAYSSRHSLSPPLYTHRVPASQTPSDRRGPNWPPHLGERLGQTRLDGSDEPTDQRVSTAPNPRPDRPGSQEADENDPCSGL